MLNTAVFNLNIKSQGKEIEVLWVYHKIDFKKQSPSIAMDLMYNQNAEKTMTQTQTTPHYHESKPQETQPAT
jgi:hypothetical protein